MDIEDKTHKAIILLKDIAEWKVHVCVCGGREQGGSKEGSREGVRKGGVRGGGRCNAKIPS